MFGILETIEHLKTSQSENNQTQKLENSVESARDPQIEEMSIKYQG